MNLLDPGVARPSRKRDGSLIAGAPIGANGPLGDTRERLRALLLMPDLYAMGHRNRLSNAAFFLLAAAGGSAASVVAAILAIWALISAGIGRFRFRLQPSDYPVVGSSLLFFAALALSDLVHSGPVDALLAIGSLLPFLMPLFLVPRMRLSRFADTLPPAFLGSAIGGALLIPILLFEYAAGSLRAQGFAGNPGPLSVMGLLCAGWSVLHVTRSGGRWNVVLALAGVVGGSLAVILSGMRGAWPLLPVCLCIAIFARRREFLRLLRDAMPETRVIVFACFALLLGAIAIAVMPLIGMRLSAAWKELGLIAANVETPTSLNLRREMYGAALHAIWEQPILGYGSAAPWDAVSPYLTRRIFRGLSFTHFHNVVLTVGVQAGIVGILAFLAMVAAPVVTAWRARRTIGGGRRLAAASILVVAFVGAGMTNIMLFHDILDAVWVFALALLAASVPAARRSASV